MPMFDVGGNFNHVAGIQRLCGFSFFLVPAIAVNADKYLTTTVSCMVYMPIVTASWFEGDVEDGEVAAFRAYGIEP